MDQNMLFSDMSDGSEAKAAKLRRNEKPMARTTDPPTSHEAAANHEASGKKRRHIEWVTDLVWKYPGCTPGELALKASAENYDELDYIEIQRRVSECSEIHRGDKRRCEVKGTMASVLMPGGV